MERHILLCGNTAWGMFNFRRGLIEALITQGNKVTVVAPYDDTILKLKAIGCNVCDLKISAKGVNPLEDLGLLLFLTKLYRILKPDFIFHYTIKPNIYGSMAARFAGIPSIAVTTGLGYTFQSSGVVASISRILYTFAFRSPKQVWFLNQDDMDEFIDAKLIDDEKAYLLDSEGVNTDYFKPAKSFEKDGKTRFLLIARMLRDKGVGEFVEAAREIRTKHPNVIFQLLGEADANNPSAISRQEIGDWEKEGIVEYIGTTTDVRPAISFSDCVVLPSYREGVPRTLLEAAAMGKPIVTTDSAGCRETLQPNKTGWLCEPKSANSLIGSLEEFLDLSESRREDMGRAARKYIVARFDEKNIIEKYLTAID